MLIAFPPISWVRRLSMRTRTHARRDHQTPIPSASADGCESLGQLPRNCPARILSGPVPFLPSAPWLHQQKDTVGVTGRVRGRTVVPIPYYPNRQKQVRCGACGFVLSHLTRLPPTTAIGHMVPSLLPPSSPHTINRHGSGVLALCSSPRRGHIVSPPPLLPSSSPPKK